MASKHKGDEPPLSHKHEVACRFSRRATFVFIQRSILRHRIGDLVPNKLVEGAVLRLCFEGGDVGGCFGSVLHTLAGSGADFSKTSAIGYLGLRKCCSAFATDVGEIRVCQHNGVGGSSRTVHIGGTCLLGDFARDMVNRVEIKDFSHSRSAIGSQRVSLCSTMRPMLPALRVANLHFVSVYAAVPLCCERGKGLRFRIIWRVPAP